MLLKAMNKKREIIVYFGIIQYDYQNAMCQRAEGIKALIESLGYTPMVIAVNDKVKQGQVRRRDSGTYEINAPKTIKEWLRSCLSAQDIYTILENIGVENIHAVIMADYRFVPMKKVWEYCKHNNIFYITDIMDWFIPNKSIISKIKKIDNDLRMHLLYQRIERKIYICSSYKNILNENECSVVIPGVTWTNKKKVEKKNYDNKIVLSFAGRPGAHCEKEKIDWVIKAISAQKVAGKIIFYIAGVTKEEFLANNSNLKNCVNESIVFLGRIDHQRCIELLQKSDFSIVIRSDNRLSNYGFSTKIGESFSYGIPVLSTDTSDNKEYIKDGINGFVCDCSYESTANMIKMVSCLTRDQLDVMKKNTIAINPLSYEKYINEFGKVIGVL